MIRIKKNIDVLLVWLIGAVGAVSPLIFSFIGVDKLSIVIWLLSALLIFAGWERFKQRIEIENKLTELVESLGGIELIEGVVTEVLIEKLKTAKHTIRSTAFFKYEHKDELHIDKYYEALGNLIRLNPNTITYTCCYAQGYDFDSRKKVFDKLSLTETELSKMFYYELKAKFPVNLIIIDTSTVIIGFRRHTGNEKTNLSIKIEASSEKNRNFIEGFASWYDNFLRSSGTFKKSAVLLGDKL